MVPSRELMHCHAWTLPHHTPYSGDRPRANKFSSNTFIETLYFSHSHGCVIQYHFLACLTSSLTNVSSQATRESNKVKAELSSLLLSFQHFFSPVIFSLNSPGKRERGESRLLYWALPVSLHVTSPLFSFFSLYLIFSSVFSCLFLSSLLSCLLLFASLLFISLFFASSLLCFPPPYSPFLSLNLIEY